MTSCVTSANCGVGFLSFKEAEFVPKLEETIYRILNDVGGSKIPLCR